MICLFHQENYLANSVSVYKYFLHASAQISLLFYFSMIQEIFPQNQNKDLGTSLLGKTSCSSSFYEHPVFVLLHVLKISAIWEGEFPVQAILRVFF